MLAAKVFDQAPSPGVEQRLLVLSETVQEVENGKASLLCAVAVIVRWQLHTVVNSPLEDATIYRVTVSPALGAGCQGKEDQQ